MKRQLQRGIVWGTVWAAGMLVAGQVGHASPVPVTSRFEISPYGYIKLDAAYDTQRTLAGNLMYYVLPESPEGRQAEFNLTARETRLGINARVPDLENVRASARIEADFFGAGAEHSPTLRLRLAYVDLERGSWTLRAGQDWDAFINALPRILNFSFLADAGALGLRRPQFRITRVTPMGRDSRLVSRLAAARTIGGDVDADGQDDGAAAGYPTGQFSLVFDTPGPAGRRALVGFSGHGGAEKAGPYTVTTAGGEAVDLATRNLETWSLIGSVVLPVSRNLLVQGSIWNGKNLDAYFGGIRQGVNAQTGDVIAAQGGWVQLVMDATDKLNINFGYGLDNPHDEDLNDGDRSQNRIHFANALYTLNTATVLAAEYSYLKTSYKDMDNAVNNRIQASVIFRF